MVQAGLTPMQVLHAGDLGMLQAGKWADLIVLNKNPFEDTRNTRTIQAVSIAGKRID